MSNAALSSFWPLPSPPSHLEAHYDVVVLGTGLGGALAASRLAAGGLHVALFEPAAELGQEPGAGERPFAHQDALFAGAALPARLRADRDGLARAAAQVDGAAAHAQGEAALTAAYLGDAMARGVPAFVNFVPQRLEVHQQGYALSFQIEHVGRERFDAPLLFVTTRAVVVATGTEAGRWLARCGLTVSAQAGVRCAMAEGSLQGGADAEGRVFTGEDQTVHGGLYVAGGALCPADWGICPTLSLATLVTRNVTLWLSELKAGPIETAPLLAAPAQAGTAGLRFTEAMKGFVSAQVTADGAFDAGFRRGQEEQSSLVFVLTLVTESVDGMNRDPEHPARAVGTVVAPALHPRPLLVAGGHFNLFVDQRDGSRRMKYRMKLLSDGGRCFFFDGYKVIRDDPGLDVWADTTTLYVTVYDGDSEQAPVWGRGLLHILPQDFASQLLTFHVFGARTPWQQMRAQTAFMRLFLGTLFETYVGAARLLPDLRKPGGWLKLVAAKLALAVAVIAGLLFWIWPWRPAPLRNQPQITSQGKPLALPSAIAQLGLFPEFLEGLALDDEAAETLETQRYHCSWIPDNLVQTHGGIGAIPFHPPDIGKLTDLAIRRGFVNLTRIRNDDGQVVGIGHQLETVILDKDAVAQKSIDAFTDWSLTFPDRGMLFMGQVEGGPDLAELQNEVKKTGRAWQGLREMNRSLGPLTDGYGIVHAGTGGFRNVIGAFREFNIVKEVPVLGDMVADTRYELQFVHASPQAQPATPEIEALRLPPRCTRRLKAGLPWRMERRQLTFSAKQDLIYRTAGLDVDEPVFPASLGPLSDQKLAGVRVLLAKLRDEHGAVTGLAAAASSEPGDNLGYQSQWTLLVSGAGSLYVATDGNNSESRPTHGYMGDQRGLILGGTGVFANATGVLHERWPLDGQGDVTFDITLVTRTP